MPTPRTFSLKYPGWFEKRQDLRRKLDRINNGIRESEEEQLDYLRTVFGAVGENLYFLEPVSFVNGKNIFIGDHVFINPNVTFIDANCTIFPGVTIGDNVIIGSNSVVNKDIPSNTVAFGSPARAHHAIEDDTGDAPGA